jgi:hypothetical protein
MQTRPSPLGPNRRSSRRKGLRQPAVLTLANQPPRAVTVWDLGVDGMSVLSPRPVPPGSRCELHFDLPHDGAITEIHLVGKTVYSSFMGTDGFRVGLVFLELADPCAAAIERFAEDTP